MMIGTFLARTRSGQGDRPLAALLLAAGMAAWLLWHPGLVQEVSWPWRWPMVVLGGWALGCAFLRPLALEAGERGLWRLTGTAWSRASLPLFALLLVGRSWLG
ncbi:hypothetical protein [Halomonas organivorans]|uniref:Uncharacterized protein n=1 Tax=Halomonas organivorans TaxID=257772 RepID=A0A7W5BZY9_9GAMM|nr:hypothetical protein [Halomonas organivorans]MBB3142242.1 hypothetical protein [Halomonas organivorans]